MDVLEGGCNKEGRLFMEDGWMYRQQMAKVTCCDALGLGAMYETLEAPRNGLAGCWEVVT